MLRFLLLLFFIVAPALADDPKITKDSSKIKDQSLGRCPGNSANLTLLSNGKKYSFHKTKVNWTSANETCNKMGLQLAKIMDQNDERVVAAGAKKFAEWKVWWVSKKESQVGGENSDKCVFIFHYDPQKLTSQWSCTSEFYFICQLPRECN
ncbi:uncharacterized protein LOC132204227 [Neocloeon triangulifer]|uniref:uncharacterized protein LOC132204227 n=1 Tax=Neocloeon triangulifer TaxID=2078957 RepID=UPI00286F6DAF|nr:uncharacterized protein LOC132204227 [Neocloeon triangulifer]